MFRTLLEQIERAITSKQSGKQHTSIQAHQALHENQHLNALIHEYIQPDVTYPVEEKSALQVVLRSNRDEQRDFLMAAVALQQHLTRESPLYYNIIASIKIVLQRRVPLTTADIITLVEFIIDSPDWEYIETPLLKAIERYLAKHERTPALDQALVDLLEFLQVYAYSLEQRQRLQHLQVLLDFKMVNLLLRPGDTWSDAAISEISATTPDVFEVWSALLHHCTTLKSASPSAKWLTTAQGLVARLGADVVNAALLRWFTLIDTPRSKPVMNQWGYELSADQLINENVDVLKGLVWIAPQCPSSALARALSNMAQWCYRKIPNIGARCLRLGNACVAALAAMNTFGVEQLALLQSRVRGNGPQQTISKALEQAAKAQGLTADELVELMVPTYGLEAVGQRHDVFGDYQAELQVQGSVVEVQWSRADGKQLRAVPKAAKEQYGEEIKEFQQAVADLKKMLPAQRDRIEQSYLAQRSWNLAKWRERYLDHPVVGILARRLIWHFAQGKQQANGIWFAGEIVGNDGQALTWLNDTAEVTLWHPLDSTSDDILQWRSWLNEREIQQPFKQAYREIYLLTDAERQTRIYSNRFAAHIVRQHQYNSLCTARGWRNQLRLSVDDSYPPSMCLLPNWNMRAELWVDTSGNTYERDISASGVYLYLSTDQVRFYPIDATLHYAHAGGGGYHPEWGIETPTEPLPLEQIPPLVFSEMMRDVDLFVGVASIGNDPTWFNGRTEQGQQAHLDYWQNYSFGALSESAKIRKQVLEQTIPRLKIRDRCELTERFLEVRGELHTYKIHLGSGNILMAENNQYLCIVPSQHPGPNNSGNLFLPFEGDHMLAIILSKALMLADDTKISDPTILSQLRRSRW